MFNLRKPTNQPFSVRQAEKIERQQQGASFSSPVVPLKAVFMCTYQCQDQGSWIDGIPRKKRSPKHHNNVEDLNRDSRISGTEERPFSERY